MKRYKLLKEYPGSPKIPCTVHDPNPLLTSKHWMIYEDNRGIVLKGHVLDNPDYWQEIIEEDKSIMISIGDDTGNLFVHRSYKAIEKVQEILIENEKLRKVKELIRGDIRSIQDHLLNP